MAAKKSGASTFTVQIDEKSLRELKRAIREAGPTARAAVRKRIKAVGVIVAEEIKARAPVKTGRLRRSTSVRPGSLSVKVVNTALARSAKYPQGYRYAKRLEFDPKLKGRFAFFYPGWEAKKEEAVALLREVLDEVGREFSRGGKL